MQRVRGWSAFGTIRSIVVQAADSSRSISHVVRVCSAAQFGWGSLLGVDFSSVLRQRKVTPWSATQVTRAFERSGNSRAWKWHVQSWRVRRFVVPWSQDGSDAGGAAGKEESSTAAAAAALRELACCVPAGLPGSTSAQATAAFSD